MMSNRVSAQSLSLSSTPTLQKLPAPTLKVPTFFDDTFLGNQPVQTKLDQLKLAIKHSRFLVECAAASLTDTPTFSRSFPFLEGEQTSQQRKMSGSSSPLSSLSSAPPSDDEMPSFMLNDQPVDALSPSDAISSPAAEQSTPKRKRAPSPPHEEVLADNQDIAVSTLARQTRTQWRDLSPIRDSSAYRWLTYNILT